MQLERARAALQPAETRTDVIEEARLAGFSIVDNVETDFQLARYDLRYCRADVNLESLPF
jgi:hypothetical protein